MGWHASCLDARPDGQRACVVSSAAWPGMPAGLVAQLNDLMDTMLVSDVSSAAWPDMTAGLGAGFVTCASLLGRHGQL